MFRRFGKPVLLLAAFAVLFATVCPLALTPTAVAKVKPLKAVSPAIALVVQPLIAAAIARPAHAAPQAQLSADVLSLTCVHTC